MTDLRQDDMRFEPINRRHVTELCEIIMKEWYDEEEIPAAEKRAWSQLFVNQHLADSTFGYAAILNGEVVGVTLACVNGEQSLGNLGTSGLYEAALLLDASPAVREKMRQTIVLEKETNEQMLIEVETKRQAPYAGHLELLITSAKARGLGVGSRLFQASMNYLDENGIEEFYLYTDTDCTYEYYEYKGLVRQLERVRPGDERPEPFRYFIYEGLVADCLRPSTKKMKKE